MAVPGSRSNSRGEGQGYPRPNRPAGQGQPYRRPSEDEGQGPRFERERPTAPPPRPTPPPLTRPAVAKEPVVVNNAGFLTDDIRELIKLMSASDLTEINIENGAQKILIKREPPRVVMSEPAPRNTRSNRLAQATQSLSTPEMLLPIADPGSPPEDSFHKLTAPMVGTFYRASDPKGKPFVEEGDMVEKGQVIGIIEAMKIMNEIQSEHSGRCMRVVVENGQPVEYGQTLIVLEPA